MVRGKWRWLVVTVAAAVASAALAQPPEVTAGQTQDPIHLDGVVDEPAWENAGVIRELVQQEPEPGAPTPFHTEVRILSRRDALYVAFVCRDPRPERIAVHTMQRDGDMRGDDRVLVVLDPFGDGRRGYAFQVNAAGARRDGLISDPEHLSTDWDGIWDAAARRTSQGWTVEIVIPALTLRFPPGRDAWGFNVERVVARERLVLRWSGISLDAPRYDLRRAGRLRGLAILRQGKGLSVSPFALVRRERDLEAHRGTVAGDAGLDISYNLTPDLAAIFTLNTDFAETEVDTRRINLTRFELFFPEKRAFFLEGSELFSFGVGLWRDFIPFFSRRVGLREGRQVPLLGGLKVLGRAGRFSIAALDAVTGDSSVAPGTNLFAGRVTYDVTGALTVGAIVTDGDPDGVSDNSLYGLDVLWQTSTFRGDKNLAVGGWAAWSRGDVPEGRRTGWGLKLDYPNDLWDVYVIVKEFGEALDPALGFLPRPGTRWYQAGGAYQPRPGSGALDWIRQAFFELRTQYVTDLDGRVESWRVFTAPFNVETESGEHLEVNWVPQYERLVEPFELADGVVIPPGEYTFHRYRIELESSDHRPLVVGGRVWFGDFYSGRLTQWEGSVSYATGDGRFSLTLEGEHDQGHFPEGDMIQRLWQLRLVYALTPDLVVSSYTQYDSDSREIGTNTRLRWTIQPGNDLYVVWNHGWRHPLGARSRLALVPVSDQLVVKLRWTWRS